MVVEKKGRPQVGRGFRNETAGGVRVKGSRVPVQAQVFREVISSHYDDVSKIAAFYYSFVFWNFLFLSPLTVSKLHRSPPSPASSGCPLALIKHITRMHPTVISCAVLLLC